ncbi:OprO/OprP family phosphate-selective porin [Adhaeribacter soli]|uniref:Porin n=1 Tax=Adhaeribacter soli TaxID=2607655 RepID=A0A5N1IRK2_9BACT|nr:porin [Adhaeribacter soli]KAA9332630.1 porin [Adhaeribacter soli]
MRYANLQFVLLQHSGTTRYVLVLFRIVTLAFLLLRLPLFTYAQDTTAISPDSTIFWRIEAGDEADIETPRRQLIKWNEYSGPYFSIRLGGGLLYDVATYEQDAQSKEQVGDLKKDIKFRDGRFLFKGRFGPDKMKHPVTYTMGIMYNQPTKSWLFRETGIMVGVPELRGSFFIGRTKEGFSLNKVMVGYAGWTMERSTMSDATIPILGDGIKYYAYLPGSRIGWNVGYFFDQFNENQAFSSYDNQVVARIMWLPILSDPERKVFHIGINLRQGNVDKDTLQLRSRPESWTAPYFVDTKKFRATQTFMYGGEIYYRHGPWLFGSEYWFMDAKAPEKGNPRFHGGDIVATWLITGETRAYNTAGGFFKGISPNRTVFEGGPGAIEAVLRISYIDLDDKGISGGKFWRITPMMNWHMSDNIRLEIGYGYGELDRLGLEGGTQFFQGRIQFQL